jgi:hypothetical protein
VPAEAEAAAVAKARVEACPFPHERVLAVRTDDPPTGQRVEVDVRAPAQLDTNGFGVFYHHSMQSRTPYASPEAGGKTCIDSRAAIEEANASERERLRGVNRHSEFG